MILLAAFCVLLAKYSRQTDIVVGSPFANRLTVESESLVGFVNNTVILRVRQDGGLSFRELLSQVRHTVIGASEHQELPFEHLVRALQPARDIQRMALFQVNFRLQNIQPAQAAFSGLSSEIVEIDNGAAKFDLACEMTNGARRGYIEYNTDLFDKDTAERLATEYGDLLSVVGANPDIPLATLHGLG